MRIGRTCGAALLVCALTVTHVSTPAFAADVTMSASDGNDAPASLDITSTNLSFDASTISIDVTVNSLGNPFGDWAWVSGQNLLGVDLSFNNSGYAEAVIAFGAKNSVVRAVGENQNGKACAVSATTNGNTLRLSTEAACYGRPGQISYNVLATNGVDVDATPNSGLTSTASQPGGYWLLGADGGIFSFGNAPFHGSTGNLQLNQPVVAMSAVKNGSGYRFVATDGGVFAYGDGPFYGSMGGKPLNQPIVGIASTNSGDGYWLVASDGGIFAYGDAQFYGSMGGKPLNQPIVGMVPTSSSNGYWLVASDGGIFAYGDAQFYGSMGGIRLNQSITSMSPSPSGSGYYLLAADGGIFAYGDAPFRGSGVGSVTGKAVGISIDGYDGYRIADGAGGVHQFGTSLHFGDLPDAYISPNRPVVGIATF